MEETENVLTPIKVTPIFSFFMNEFGMAVWMKTKVPRLRNAKCHVQICIAKNLEQGGNGKQVHWTWMRTHYLMIFTSFQRKKTKND